MRFDQVKSKDTVLIIADDLLDEDDMASDSDTQVASQQSIKAYADTKIADLINDTTPQLGGDLDLNGNAIDFPTTANISDCLDEDDMISDSATMLATQQSIRAYVDNNLSNIVCFNGEIIVHNDEVVIL